MGLDAQFPYFDTILFICAVKKKWQLSDSHSKMIKWL